MSAKDVKFSYFSSNFEGFYDSFLLAEWCKANGMAMFFSGASSVTLNYKLIGVESLSSLNDLEVIFDGS